ncbi:MAG: hypothetical protein ACK553_12925 [Planctomycetota bacterium]|jgi:hypothetical protein
MQFRHWNLELVETESELDVGEALYGATGMMGMAPLRDVKASLEDLMSQRLEDFDAGPFQLGLCHATRSETSEE